jgi:1,4-alpha-glucan branching enzyme
MAYSRADLIFIFNFHPTNSYTEYGIPVSEGKYAYLFSTDELKFGGYGRLDETQNYQSVWINEEVTKQQILLYLPARTALVLKKMPIPKVYQRIPFLNKL